MLHPGTRAGHVVSTRVLRTAAARPAIGGRGGRRRRANTTETRHRSPVRFRPYRPSRVDKPSGSPLTVDDHISHSPTTHNLSGRRPKLIRPESSPSRAPGAGDVDGLGDVGV